MPWQSFINNQSNTIAFNLTMGSRNLTNAMHLFGSEVKTSLFESEGKAPELEVFFPAPKWVVLVLVLF
jgi:hypothetical protein